MHEIGKEDCLVMEWDRAVSGVESGSSKLSVIRISEIGRLLQGKEVGQIPETTPWDHKMVLNRLEATTVDYSQYKSDQATLLRTIDALLKDGIVFLTGVNYDEKSGQSTELRRVVERIGSVRTTWYGRLFDVKAEEGSRNIAYTNLDLGLHMDLTHFESPPRYQFLHCLQNTAIIGGQSYFVDSYAVANGIRESNPQAFETLCKEPVLFSYKNGDHHTRFTRPTIELDRNTNRINAVNYSPPFQGPLPLLNLSDPTEPERLSRLHEALRLFAQGCDDPSMRYSTQLEPGDCVIFDNRRVLHARTAFEFAKTEENQDQGEAGRWLKGAYMDATEVQSKWRVLTERLKGTLL